MHRTLEGCFEISTRTMDTADHRASRAVPRFPPEIMMSVFRYVIYKPQNESPLGRIARREATKTMLQLNKSTYSILAPLLFREVKIHFTEPAILINHDLVNMSEVCLHHLRKLAYRIELPIDWPPYLRDFSEVNPNHIEMWTRIFFGLSTLPALQQLDIEFIWNGKFSHNNIIARVQDVEGWLDTVDGNSVSENQGSGALSRIESQLTRKLEGFSVGHGIDMIFRTKDMKEIKGEWHGKAPEGAHNAWIKHVIIAIKKLS